MGTLGELLEETFASTTLPFMAGGRPGTAFLLNQKLIGQDGWSRRYLVTDVGLSEQAEGSWFLRPGVADGPDLVERDWSAQWLRSGPVALALFASFAERAVWTMPALPADAGATEEVSSDLELWALGHADRGAPRALPVTPDLPEGYVGAPVFGLPGGELRLVGMLGADRVVPSALWLPEVRRAANGKTPEDLWPTAQQDGWP